MISEQYLLSASKEWSNDAWWKDQENRTFIKNSGPYAILKGEAEGKIIGANLCTFNLLHGTSYMPSLKNSILFLEDDDTSNPLLFDRDLQSLIHQPGFEGVKGIVIGRFEKKSEMSRDLLQKIIKSKKELEKIPVIADADFGHTYPMFSFPIGGEVKIEALKNYAKIYIKMH